MNKFIIGTVLMLVVGFVPVATAGCGGDEVCLNEQSAARWERIEREAAHTPSYNPGYVYTPPKPFEPTIEYGFDNDYAKRFYQNNPTQGLNIKPLPIPGVGINPYVPYNPYNQYTPPPTYTMCGDAFGNRFPCR
jgi:hypothetical protein